MTSLTIPTWTAKEVRALRDAARLTVEAFAAKLGVSTRIVNKWESGEAVPKSDNQSNLDTFLGVLIDAAARERFVAITGITPAEQAPTTESSADDPPRIALPDDTYIRHPRDGRQMALVSEGIFLSGANGDVPLWLSSFYIDVYPVSIADYLRFLAATGHPAPTEWSTHGTPPADLHTHPIVFVTWDDAHAYATWAGKMLPSSAQWEKAARGTRGSIYPWGSAMTPAKCNTRENGIEATTPVDRYHSGASIYGVYDLCGNVWEWCSNEPSSGRHELKGSAFTSFFHRATPSNFNDAAASMKDNDTGFRCVATPHELIAPPLLDGSIVGKGEKISKPSPEEKDR